MKQLNVQVWIRILDIPMEFRRVQTLFNIARGVGYALKINPKTRLFDHGLFARALVNIDLEEHRPEQVLVTLEETGFFVKIEYKKLPTFCVFCKILGHSVDICRRNTTNIVCEEGPHTVTVRHLQ